MRYVIYRLNDIVNSSRSHPDFVYESEYERLSRPSKACNEALLVLILRLTLTRENVMGTELTKPLRRSRDHKLVAGVCGGLAEWLDWDPTAVRAIYVIGSLVSAAFPGFLAYIILWFVIPKEEF